MVAMVRKLIRGRTDKGKRADKRASTPRAKAAKERRERKLNTKRYRNVPVKKASSALYASANEKFFSKIGISFSKHTSITFCLVIPFMQ